MKNNDFRPVDFWKSVILSAPDNSFFELLRSVFGKIKTPFNKQQLLIDLEKFLLREDIQKAIASYIDENDAKVITAISLLGEPAPVQLESFFSGEFSYAQLLDIIVNLEERFILYRFTEDKKIHLSLNPVLKTVLLPFTTDASCLFPAVSAGKEDAVNPAPPLPESQPDQTTDKLSGEGSPLKPPAFQAVSNDLLLAGILSFASQFELFYRVENENKVCVIRKRVIAAGKTFFPGIDLNQLIGSFLILGLFYIDEEKLIPDRKRLDDFGMLSVRERSEYCAAALLVFNETSAFEILPPVFRSRIREIVNLIHTFLNSLKPELKYPDETLKRMFEVLKMRNGVNIVTEKLIAGLIKTGLIITAQDGLKQSGAITRHETSHNDKPVIALDSGFSILVYPEVNFSDAICLASFSKICETGSSLITPVFRFELDKDSAIRAFNDNIAADEIIKLINRLSGKKADDSFIWNLKDWEKRHEEVSLKKGVILTLAEKHRYLTETNSLAPLITETLAPGLYLLNEDAIEDASFVLHTAGIDIIGRRKPVNPKTNKTIYNNHFPAPSASSSQYSAINYNPSDTDSLLLNKENEFAAVLAEGFHAVLKTMQLSDTEKAELSARIDRRLVLCEAQLREAHLRFEKLEAKLMDYTGKQNIAKQAISQQSPVEVIVPKKGTDGEKIFGIPKALEKEGNELFLVVDTMQEKNEAAHAGSDPSAGSAVRRIALAKIIRLRRIKKSIFEK